MAKNGVVSFSVRIDATNAILNFKLWAKLAGLSAQSQGKQYKDWSPSDRKLWDSKIRDKLLPLLSVNIYYLSSEDAFFVRPNNINPYITAHEDKVRLYQATVAGESMEEECQLRIYTRIVNKVWCLTIARYYTNGELGDNQIEKFQVLCDFPIAITQPIDNRSDLLDKLGFKVEDNDSVDGYIDEFGDYTYFNFPTEIEKNGVKFTLN